MKILGFGDNTEINPEGYRELGFVKNFREPESGITLNTGDLTINREALVRLRKWIYQEQGRFENPPLQIETESGTNLDFYLDLQTLEMGLHDATMGVQARKSDGHFFENANNLTFELLHSEGFLTGLAVDVPYLIVPDNLQALIVMTSLTTLSLLYQLASVTFEIVKSAAAFLDIASTGILVAAAQAVALLVWLGTTIFALIQSLVDLKELIFPSIRYFLAYRDLDLIKKGCEYLGYSLASTVLSTELRRIYTLGVPLAEDGKSVFNSYLPTNSTGYFNKGYPTAQDTTPTLGDLIRFYLETYNLRAFIFDGVVTIEKRSFFSSSAVVNIVPTLSDQQSSDDRYTFNEDDVWGRTYDHWAVDYTDLHSPDTFDGMKSEHITTQIQTLNPDLVRLTGLKENAAPFSLASRKDQYTAVEERFISVFGLYDNLISQIQNFIGGTITGTNPITNRIGVMIIEKEYFAVTKKLWGFKYTDNTFKQSSDYKKYLSMDYIYNNYKKDLEVNQNNYIEKTITVPFTDDNFISLLQNNYVNYKGYFGGVEVVRIEWRDKQYEADITVLLPDNSAFNTQTVKLS